MSGSLLIEHQQIPSNPVSTFQGSALEFAQFCNEQFNGESSYKGVLRHLVRMLVDWFGLSEVVYLTLDTSRSDESLRRSIMRFPPASGVDESAIGSLRAALQAVVAGEDEMRLGHHVIRALGEDYFCAQFDEPGPHRGVLVWRESVREGQSFGVLLGGDNSVSRDGLREFLVRSAQHVAQWLRRMDSTQALLYQDEVTGLFNYRFLDVAIDSELRRLQRFHSPFSLLFIDLDNFKQVNDVYGHLTGSSVLRQVGAEIKAAVRDVDSVIRYGGDEFVVVLLGAGSRQAWLAAERVRMRVESQMFKTDMGDAKIRVTTSIGVACCPEHGTDKSTLLKLADETMYTAKKSGKNRVIMLDRSSHANDAHTGERSDVI